MALFVGSWSRMIFIGCFVYKIIIFSHLWCILGGSVWIWTKSNTLWSIESQTHYGTSWHVKLSLTLNELI